MSRLRSVLLAALLATAASMPVGAQSPSAVPSPTPAPTPVFLPTPYVSFLNAVLPTFDIFLAGLHGNWSQSKAQVDQAAADLTTTLLGTYPDRCYRQGYGEMWQLVGTLRSISFLLSKHDPEAAALFGKALDFVDLATFDDGTSSCAKS